MPDIIEAVRAGLAPHYMVEREIGAGGMARVFLAAERQPPRQVAIKVMNPHRFPESDGRIEIAVGTEGERVGPVRSGFMA